jgi:uncharacterized protein (TIGR03437 family)
MTIAYGDFITCAIELIGDTDIFRFTASTGEVIAIQVTRQGRNGQPCVEVFDPQGNRIADRACGGLSPVARLDPALTMTGDHTIRVSEWEGLGPETLEYALVLERLTPVSPAAVPIRYGQSLAGDIAPVGGMNLYAFAGAPGDNVTVSVTRRGNNGQPCLELFDPVGVAIGTRVCGDLSLVARASARPTRSGNHIIRVTESEALGTETLSYAVDLQCVGACPVALAIATTPPLAEASPGAAYSQSLQAAGGSPPYTWSIIGSLPPGITINPSTGLLSGTPTATGSFSFSVRVSDSAGASASREFTLTVSSRALRISSSALTFQQLVGGAPAPSQQVNILSPNGLNFTATAAAAGGGRWLSVTPASGVIPATLTVQVNPAGLDAGVYSGSVTISASGATDSPQTAGVQLLVSRQGGPPLLSAAGVVNAASFRGGSVAPGEILTIFGLGLGPATLSGLRLESNSVLATLLADTRVLFDSIPAPLLYVHSGQISAVVPYAVAGSVQTRLQVEYRGARSDPVALRVAASAPGIFTLDSSGRGPGAILNQDTTVNSSVNPAERGSVVSVFATGEGEVAPQVPDGILASVTVLPRPRLPVRVTIGGAAAEVLYAGASPGLVVGLLQVNARIPPETPSGTVPVVLTVGEESSQSGVTMAIR